LLSLAVLCLFYLVAVCCHKKFIVIVTSVYSAISEHNAVETITSCAISEFTAAAAITCFSVSQQIGVLDDTSYALSRAYSYYQLLAV
jgi:hypothetical protein